MLIPTWYIPSFYGDVRLQSTGPKTCTLIAEKTTEAEKQALRSLTEQARKKGWIDRSAGEIYLEGNTLLDAPIDKVSRAVAKILKPGRTMISAVKFTDGGMEEIRETASVDAVDASRRAPAVRTPIAAASVAQPVRGCPPPDFDDAEIKARRVLEIFLNGDQIEDFRRYNRFISVGASGVRYMVTSRHARGALAKYQRTLYDLDTNQPLCVHDWAVPAAEEILGLHLLLQMPRWERYLRFMENDRVSEAEHLMNFGPEIVREIV